jgi:hypothetical protein
LPTFEWEELQFGDQVKTLNRWSLRIEEDAELSEMPTGRKTHVIFADILAAAWRVATRTSR